MASPTAALHAHFSAGPKLLADQHHSKIAAAEINMLKVHVTDAFPKQGDKEGRAVLAVSEEKHATSEATHAMGGVSTQLVPAGG